MRLWVGILFLVVSSQLGINARPIPRPTNEAIESFHSNSWVDELRMSNYDRPRVQTQTFSEEREEEGPVDDDEIHRFLELQKFIRGELFAESTYFDSGNKGNGENNEKDSRSQGIRPEVEDVYYGDTVESEKERVAAGKEKEDDHITDDKSDLDNTNVLKTQSEVGHGDYNGGYSETEHEGSAVRGMDEEDEEDHDDFPFEHSYFKPTYVEDIHAPEDLLLASQEQDEYDDDRITDDESDLDNTNLLKTQSEEELEDYNGGHSETEYDESAVRGMDEEDEDVYDDDFPFEHSYFRPTYVEDIHVPEDLAPLASHEQDHGRRATRESHENTDHKIDHATETEYDESGIAAGFNHHSIQSGLDEESEVDDRRYAARYLTTESHAAQDIDAEFWNGDMEPGYTGALDNLDKIKRDDTRENHRDFPGESHMLSRDGTVDNAKDFLSRYEDSLQEEREASELVEDDEASGDDFKSNPDAAYDTNASGLMDEVAYSEDNSQPGYYESKGVAGDHMSGNFEENN